MNARTAHKKRQRVRAGKRANGDRVLPWLTRTERESLYRQLITRDGALCALCGRTVFDLDRSLDHIIPRSEGGGDEVWNLRMTHPDCNSRRAAMEAG